ncbi:preprotein translocase subunit SecE [Propionibacterium freudenreichii]|uniref:Protein translocase subunit SecE n=3 Tax=Propionibacterium freudenreichii TaxID=1744 RepID=D7GJ06_PROFC|nr:preprotein translocase subunit SecE [Propionibacterium freudenreichii]CBL56078.1 SecE/Sec61-gamma subunit of protein translocation complex [Propionibacterium freudenreichii subsp. shermanii CIRM-BIA1]AWY96300.1 SecE/Sec61-gamma subunit of protein translocation complex [Propionibacterium freudenreichii]CDP47975.1 SecE/Sec61-gamma subunit of protein translocation complex [Propionibacterium freudenreichii subsp. freudenreichii]CEG89512.1 SecE/Sec61-gamma subunit of protein translocation complex
MADRSERAKRRAEQAQSGPVKRHRSTGEHMEADDLPGSMLPEANGEPDPAVIDDADAEELTNADDTVDSTPDKGDPDDVRIDDESQLDEAERRADEAQDEKPTPIVRKHSTSPVRKAGGARAKAGKPTQAKKGHKRAGPITFTKQSVGELKKVVWPTGEQTGQYFVVVLVFVLFIMAVVAGLDFGLTRLLLWLFG